jgi:hypothetical protein
MAYDMMNGVGAVEEFFQSAVEEANWILTMMLLRPVVKGGGMRKSLSRHWRKGLLPARYQPIG